MTPSTARVIIAKIIQTLQVMSQEELVAKSSRFAAAPSKRGRNRLFVEFEKRNAEFKDLLDIEDKTSQSPVGQHRSRSRNASADVKAGWN